MKRQELPRRDFMKGALAAGAAGCGAVMAQAEETEKLPALKPEPGQKVPRKELGSTGVKIPILIMGTCQELDPEYDKRLHRAYQFGVDHIDTAEMYDNYKSHKTIAPFIKQIVDRKKLFISSKAHNKIEEATPEKFKKQIDKSLAELETDHLDLFFIHMAHDEGFLAPEYLKMAEELKKSGKIKFFGVSCHDGSVPRMLMKAAEVHNDCDAVMFRYNFRQYGDRELNLAIDAAKNAGVGLIAIKTLAAIPDDAEEIEPFVSKNFSRIQAKLKAVWADDRIDGIASQMGNVQHVMENAAAAISEKPLTMSEFHQLNRLAARTCAEYCTGCNHICESRIDTDLRVADILRYVMYHDAYGNRDYARARYQALPPHQRDDHVDLRAAMAACPQKIDLPQKLAYARRILSA
jgi:uncharacterized protein